MLFPPKLYLKDRWILLPLVVIAATQAFAWWYVISKIRPTGEQLFLHYNIIFGVDLVGEWWKLWLLPLGGLVLWLVNFLLSYFFYNHNRFLARFLAVTTALFEVLLVVAILLIVSLNG